MDVFELSAVIASIDPQMDCSVSRWFVHKFLKSKVYMFLNSLNKFIEKY